MGKNKKKKAQMFKDFLAFKANVDKSYGYQWPNPGTNSGTPSSFQTPHGDQEKLTELFDDNSPNIDGNQTGASGSGLSVKPGQQGKWTALKAVEDASKIHVNMRQDTSATRPEESKPNVQIGQKPFTHASSQKPIGQTSSLKPEQSSSQQQAEAKKNTREQLNPMISTQQHNKPTSNVTSYPVFVNKAHVWLAGIPRSFLGNPNSPVQAGQTGPAKSSSTWVPNNVPGITTPVSPPAPPQSNSGSGWPKSKISPQNTRQISALNTPMYGDFTQQGNFAQQGNFTQQGNFVHQGNSVGNIAQQGNSAQQSYSAHGRNSPIFKEEPLKVDTNMCPEPPQAYSPSDVYSEAGHNEDEATDDELESPDAPKAGSKRLSAFKRLGPPAAEPKKPKLTVNLLLKQDVRAVVDETDDCPTHLKPELAASTDEIVVKYLESWPWKKTTVPIRTATFRHSKSVMILEQEYMEESYVKDSRFMQIVVTGYPPTWKKEDVLDAVLDSVKGHSFIPCFVDFTKVHCRFLVIRCRQALLAIHKYGFVISKDDVELIMSIAAIHLNLNNLDFVPRLILRRVMANRLVGDALDLSRFTAKDDISHFIYFPLYRAMNQIELVQLQSTVPWDCLTTIDLSHNKIKSISGFDFKNSTPKLRHLNLSYNRIESVMILLPIRNLPLISIQLEGNPLCNDYIEEEHYIKVLTMLFPGLQEIDGVLVKKLHDLPDSKRNYCPEEAKLVVDKLLEVMFPLLDAAQEQRFLIQEMYSEDAVLTVTFMYKLRYSPIYRDYRNLFNRARILDEGDMEAIVGASNIAKVITRWPDLLHDPATFTVDVLLQNDTTTIVRIGGIVKITAETLAEEEHLLSFTRTLVLYCKDGCEYKITNEMVYWDLPEKSYAETAFKITMVKPKSLNLRLDVPPDEHLKEKLVEVFMKITMLGKRPSERCLQAKDWQIRNALEYFSKLLKLNNLEPIMKD